MGQLIAYKKEFKQTTRNKRVCSQHYNRQDNMFVPLSHITYGFESLIQMCNMPLLRLLGGGDDGVFRLLHFVIV